MKKVPNPNGRLGGQQHQNLIDKLKNWITSLGKKFKTEYKNGSCKYVDVAVVDDNKKAIELHQVGKQNLNGTPGKRERVAIAVIEEASGVKVEFHAYNVGEK